MVSAELLAQLEHRCREIMRDLSLGKFAADGSVEPFGGLNVILSGDLFQLPPPKGTFLGDVPWDLLTGKKKTKQATALHGQTLLWGGPAVGMQGVTELVRCERTGDTWLTEVQNQLRHGELSEDSHAFLHGNVTSVPGSWTQGRPACGARACAALVGQNPDTIRRHECARCAEERVSRQLVAHGPADPRFQEAFANATAIFATNDVKFHVNKRRALCWAAAHKVVAHIAVARDVASATVLQDKTDLAAEKLQWLQRHDQECGGLYGLLPLCLGLPVRATDHLDRQRGILKGCRGVVVGWSSPAEEVVGEGVALWNRLPEVVYIQFQTATTWHISGMPDANVYPVAPCKRVWLLDRQKKYPQLRVWRTQFPLAPAFAITAHVAQGQTIVEGVITDLNIGLGGNPFTAYVAFTRVPGRQNLLLFRPFDAKPFQRGIGVGRTLLLRHLRGEKIDWTALLNKYCEERQSCVCQQRKQKGAFTVGQWKRDEADRVCRECGRRYADAGAPWQCCICKVWHAEANFPPKYHRPQCTFYRVCQTCEERKPCVRCAVRKPEAAFGPAAWKARNVDRRICRECARKERGLWQCTTCNMRKELAQFSAWVAKRAAGQDGHQICNGCNTLRVACRYAGRTNHRLARLRARAEQGRLRAVLPALPSDATARGSDLDRRRRLVASPEVCSHLARARKLLAEEHRRGLVAEVRAQIASLATSALAFPQTQKGSQTPPAHTTAKPAPTSPGTVALEGKPSYTYVCPFCARQTQSSIHTGQIDHRQVCGNQFRVSDGLVQGRKHAHACPKCGTVVFSTKEVGRLQVQHTQPNGKPCRCCSWTVLQRK